MPTEVSGGSGPGTAVQPGAQGAVFSELNLTVQAQANALVDPSDSPTGDTARLVTDGTNVVLYVWDASAATWMGVQLG